MEKCRGQAPTPCQNQKLDPSRQKNQTGQVQTTPYPKLYAPKQSRGLHHQDHKSHQISKGQRRKNNHQMIRAL